MSGTPLSPPPSSSVRAHAIWASTVVVVILVFFDGVTAAVAASGLLAVLGAIAGYGFARFR